MSETGLWTRWGKMVQSASQSDSSYIPLAEYPRPQLVRNQYTILNGWWEYAIVPAAAANGSALQSVATESTLQSAATESTLQSAAAPGIEKTNPDLSSWPADGRILVPFSPETRLSGAGRVLQPGEVLRYRRTLEIPEIIVGKRLLLHFGGVDERCVVRLNGKFAGSHNGGYTAFTCDVTELLQEGTNILTVDVRDDSDTSFHARGKQKLAPAGMFYQAQSGIWKTVWCEWVPERYIAGLRFEADPAGETVEMIVTMAGGTGCADDTADAGAPGDSDDYAEQTLQEDFLIEYTDAQGEPRSFRFSGNDFTGNDSTESSSIGNNSTEIDSTGYFRSTYRFSFPVPSPRLWSPEDPFLYRIRVTVGPKTAIPVRATAESELPECPEILRYADCVDSYFAMRSVGISAASQDFEDPAYHGQEVVSTAPRRILLNGRPYFMHGVLDQGYWPESLMTPPSDAALEWDITACKELGFNMLRKHVKVEAARFYYHCDRLGMVVWQDAVNGGREYNANLVTNLPNILPAVQSLLGDESDKEMRRLGRQDREGRDEYRRQLREMVEELRFFPCICVWVPFNEGWGQFQSAQVADEVKSLDPGRLVDAASGWFDRGAGDLYSIHNYFRRLRIPVAPAARRAAALTEYGGLSRPVEGLTASNSMKAYRTLPTEAALTDAFLKLIRRDILPQLEHGLGAAVYTPLSDVEGEINGLFTYDRSLCKMDRTAVQAARAEIGQKWTELCGSDANSKKGKKP